MPTNADLLDEFAQLSALTGAAVATDPVAALALAKSDDRGPLRRRIEARIAPGWRGMEICSEGGWAWVRGGAFAEPALRLARGERWRRDRSEGRLAPTEWAPCEPPTWDERG